MRRRRRRSLAACGVAIGAAVLAVASPLPAQHAPSPAGKLTAAERKALQIVSVQASGADQGGMIVTATFKGNIEKALGRGHLKRGLVAVLLHRKTGGRTPLGIATSGAGYLGRTLTNTGRSARAGVLRNGRKLVFFLSGGGFEVSDFRNPEVKAFARFRRSSARTQATASLDAEYWEQIDNEIAADMRRVKWAKPLASDSCDFLRGMAASAKAVVGRAEQREEKLKKAKAEIQREIPKLEEALDKAQWVRAAALLSAVAIGTSAPVITVAGASVSPTGAAALGTGGFAAWIAALKSHQSAKAKEQALRDAIRSLKLDVRLADGYLDKNRDLITRARALAKKLNALAEVECARPHITPIFALFTQADYSTVYTEVATGPDLTYEWQLSIPADPACAAGFQGGVPDPQDATWVHKDTSEGGTCSHANYSPTSGHPGTVTVVVSNSLWVCEISYFGTLGPNGANEGEGPPGECQQK